MAAVVGVIANLALWFALHVVFARVDIARRWRACTCRFPSGRASIRAALALSLAACVALLRFHAGLAATLVGSALAGLALSFVR